MKQTLQIRLGQSLTMTPQLQQAIRLLQLSTLDLREEIQQALDSNPMLEAAEDGASDDGETALAEDVEYAAATAPAASPAAEGERGEANDSAVDLRDAVVDLDMGVGDDLPVDSVWEDVYESAVVPRGQGAELDGGDFEFQAGPSETLREHLLWQMSMTPFSERDQAIAVAIIDAVNERGYLAVPLEELHEGLNADGDIDLDEVQAVLHQVQNFDPVGVAARDLRECMLIQLQHLDAGIPWLDKTRELVAEHLDLLANREYGLLTRRLKCTQQELQQVIALAQSLNPYPGSQITDRKVEYIIPDVIVTKEKNSWKVELNPEAMPRVRINASYASLVKRADNSSDNAYMRNQLQEARWFVKSLQSRNETLLKVASCIVERQRGFLEHGEEAMKALVLHDIAQAVEMHESTISRVTTQKYMYTPRGIFELKYFFSSHVSTDSGGECSATAIRALIKKLVAAEDGGKPLSDSKIAQLLKQQGINVARRTIAKYREALAIPSSSERKRLI
ncbi:MAG: RNA polymerase factor sigma-54 [Gammaproteobacteria bacterium]